MYINKFLGSVWITMIIVEVLESLMKHVKRDILTQFSLIKCNVHVKLDEKLFLNLFNHHA